jgi:protein-arginine kinase activator protein McsA
MKAKAEKVVILKCPTCGRKHREHPEFGCFCCASCLQTIIRPLIVALDDARLRASKQPPIRELPSGR